MARKPTEKPPGKPSEAPSKPAHGLAAKGLNLSAPTLESPKLERTVEYKLRIREDLRQRLELAAEANRVSANREMVDRIAQSFEYPPTRTIEAIAADMDSVWGRYGKIFLDLSTRGDLVRATETLVEAVEQLPAAAQNKSVKAAIERAKAAINVIDAEATTAMRRFAT
jgi:hypothetical protein